MNEFPDNLRLLRILLSNDDGINAPGLKALLKVARELTDDIWICAPETEQSAAGHSLTLREPVRVRHISRQRYAVDGTPTDSVLMALHKIMAGKPPDLVLSGINRGGNMGEDITYSGTVAAAMEATLLGVPAIALSQHIANGRRTAHWPTAERYAPDLIRRLCRCGWPKGTLININFPDIRHGDVSGIEVTRQGQREIGENLDERVDPRGGTYYWIGSLRNLKEPGEGSDLAAIEENRISVTPVHLDMTHHKAMKRLREALA